MRMGINQRVEDPDRTKRQGKGDVLPLLEPGHLSTPALGYQCSWFSSLQTQTMIDTIGSPGSWAFECGLNYYPDLYWVSSSQIADHGTSQSP